jgi:hypothetical protein
MPQLPNLFELLEHRQLYTNAINSALKIDGYGYLAWMVESREAHALAVSGRHSRQTHHQGCRRAGVPKGTTALRYYQTDHASFLEALCALADYVV